MKIHYEYLLFGYLGEYYGTVYTRKEAKAHQGRMPGVYYYRRQERLEEQMNTMIDDVPTDNPDKDSTPESEGPHQL